MPSYPGTSPRVLEDYLIMNRAVQDSRLIAEGCQIYVRDGAMLGTSVKKINNFHLQRK
jgi:hypothetical protein